jgi:RimJ/RimL family protein N-acetyltransferase
LTGNIEAAPKQPPEVRAEGLFLGPWFAADAARVLEIATDPATRAWSPSMRSLQTEADALAWMGERAMNSDRVSWAVRDSTSGLLIGRVGLHRFDEGCRSAEIGYGVHPAFRRRGVALRAVTAATSYAFTTLNLARISLVHATGNAASCSVARAGGFAFEGVERSSLDHGDGVRHDMHRHARLATDVGAVPRLGRTPVVIDAGDLVLRPWGEQDAEQLLAAFADPLVARWNPRLPLPDIDAARGWLASRATGWAGGDSCSWKVVDAATGELRGATGLRYIDPIDHAAVASYWTVASARGRGVAPAALSAATGWAFTELGMHRVALAHALANEASCRVATKVGFGLEATLRDSCLLRDGFSDEHLHARLATDPPVDLS